MAPRTTLLNGIAVLLLALASQGCWVKKSFCRGMSGPMPNQCPKDNSDGGSSEESTLTVAANGSDPSSKPPPSTFVSTTTVEDSGLGLTRLTPEQVSNHIYQALGYRLQATGTFLVTLDVIVESYGVPLGGIDHDTVFSRDRESKVQTMLVARTLAWQIAVLVVNQEAAGTTTNVFTRCNVHTDEPGGGSEAAWLAQIDELYWRLYGRTPAAEEVTALKTAFTTLAAQEASRPAAWQGILYSMLASAEFWNL